MLKKIQYQIIFFLIFGVQIAYSSEAVFSLESKDHADWLFKSDIFIDGEKYSFLELPDKLPIGKHTVKCLFEIWIAEKTFNIHPRQTNIIKIQFEKNNAIAPPKIQVTPIVSSPVPVLITPDSTDENLPEGRTRPGILNISIYPEEIQEESVVMIRALSGNNDYEKKEKKELELQQGLYEIYADSKGYIASEPKIITVTSGYTAPVRLFLAEKPKGILKINFAGMPSSDVNNVIIHLKKNDTDNKIYLSYDEEGYKLPKGDYKINVFAVGYKPYKGLVSIPSKEKIKNIFLHLQRAERIKYSHLENTNSPNSTAKKSTKNIDNYTKKKKREVIINLGIENPLKRIIP